MEKIIGNNNIVKKLNPNLLGLTPSATLVINEKSNALQRQGRKIYKLGFGQSPFPVPPSMQKALEDNAHQKDYLPVRGLQVLREAIAKYWKKTQDLHFDAEDVMIGPGSKELLFILQLVYDAPLILASPSWVSYAPQSTINGKPVHWLDTNAEDNYMLKAEQLHEHCLKNKLDSAILILNYPSNPVGSTFTRQSLRDLSEVARQFNLLIVSDEIYGDLHHEGEHKSIAAYYPEGTILSSGISKWAGAGGWRMGMFSFPQNLRWLQDSMSVVASETFTSTSAPIQYAAVKAYERDADIQEQLDKSQKILKVAGQYVHQRLTAMQITAPAPEGGFYLFPNFQAHSDKLKSKGIINSRDLCEGLLEETGIALLPGSDFGRPAEELTCRLSYVDFDGAKALQGIDIVSGDDFVKQYCGRMVEAMDVLSDWVG